MSDMDSYWATDVQVSMPHPSPIAEDLTSTSAGSGWVFNEGGIAPDLTRDLAKQIGTPTFAPKQIAETVYLDDIEPEAPATDVRVF